MPKEVPFKSTFAVPSAPSARRLLSSGLLSAVDQVGLYLLCELLGVCIPVLQ